MNEIETAQHYIQAVQAGDQTALARLLSLQIVWHQPGKIASPARTREPRPLGR